MKTVSDPKNQVRPHGVHQIQTTKNTQKSQGFRACCGDSQRRPLTLPSLDTHHKRTRRNRHATSEKIIHT